MANCRDCGGFVVFLRRENGSYMPPVDPVTDFPAGEFFTASADGTAQAPPQLYRKHQCVSPEERVARARALEEEKQRLIEEDRERRRIEQETREALEQQRREEREAREAIEQARREEEEAANLEARKKEHERWLKKEYERDLKLQRHFFPERLLAIPCRDCGALIDYPCFEDKTTAHKTQRFYANGKMRTTAIWFTRRPCNARFVDGPPAPRPLPRPEYFGEDYNGPWPPRKDDPGRYEMFTFLRQNPTLFGPDAWPNRTWFTPEEVEQIGGWLDEFSSILTDTSEKHLLSPEEYERWIDDGGRVTGGVGEAGGEDRSPA